MFQVAQSRLNLHFKIKFTKRTADMGRNKFSTSLFIFCLGIAVLLMSFSLHKFYVSKTTIEFNARSGVYEVTCKLFTDDLERAIGGSDSHPVRLGSEREMPDADQRIERYLQEHLKLFFDQQATPIRYVGKESENDLTYCYFEFYRQHEFSTLRVVNTIFIELFPEQQNLLDFSANGKTQTAVMVSNSTEHVFFR